MTPTLALQVLEMRKTAGLMDLIPLNRPLPTFPGDHYNRPQQKGQIPVHLRAPDYPLPREAWEGKMPSLRTRGQIRQAYKALGPPDPPPPLSTAGEAQATAILSRQHNDLARQMRESQARMGWMKTPGHAART